MTISLLGLPFLSLSTALTALTSGLDFSSLMSLLRWTWGTPTTLWSWANGIGLRFFFRSFFLDNLDLVRLLALDLGISSGNTCEVS